MKHSKLFSIIQIDDYSATPKYRQLANSILEGIRKKMIKKGEIMPSINELSFEYNISRVTIEKGYNHLRKLGILESVPGKGYFIKSIDVSSKIKIFLLFNKLSAHKKIIYDAFVETIGEFASIDFYIYNNDINLFQKIIQNRKDDYTHLVIIPHFIDNEAFAIELINTLPKEQLILLDKNIKGITGNYAAIYENFEKDIYQSLTQALEKLSKYNTLKLVFPENSYFPKEIIEGFENFCLEYAFKYKVVSDIENEKFEKGEVYINLMEDDLIKILDKILDKKLELGKEIGLISYNETPLKRFIMNGLTTISTDFKSMGIQAAKLIINDSKEHIENTFTLNLRDSI